MVEDEYRDLDVELRRDEFEQRERHHKSQRKSVILTGLVTFLGVLVTMLVATLTILREGGQFDATLRANEYNGIVSGLASDAVAVQDSSMRRLVSYVQDADNFDSAEEQEAEYHTAMQTLTAFIVDESNESGRTGLGAYPDPQPIIVPRAMSHLETLTENEMGAVTIDVARADLHGASLADFAPRANVYAVGVDLRRANLTGLNLEADGSPSTLKSAFLTCASLVHARLGNAALDGADLTGADLRDADLSAVTGLTKEQLHGAWIGPKTLLPDDLEVDASGGLARGRPRSLLRHGQHHDWHAGLTGLLLGAPLPQVEAAAESMDVDPPWQRPLADLVEACQLRAGKELNKIATENAERAARADHRTNE